MMYIVSADNIRLPLVRLLSVLVLLATNVVIARQVSIDVFGLYLFVLACVSLGTLILIKALDVVMLRQVPKYIGPEQVTQHEPVAHLLRWVMLRLGRQALVLLVVLALLVGVAFGAGQIRSWPLSELFNPLLIAACFVLVGVLGCTALLRGFLQGLACRWAVLPEQWLHPILLLAVVTSGLLLSSNLTATQLVVCAALTSVIALGLAVFLSQREAQRVGLTLFGSVSPKAAMDAEGDSTQWSTGLTAIYVLAIAQLVLGQGDLLVLGLLRGPIDTGLYGAVLQLLSIFVFVFVALSGAFACRYKQLFAKADLPAIVQLSRCLIGLGLGTTSVLILVFWFAAPWLLGLFGDTYVTGDTVHAMRILLVAQLALVLAVSASGLLVMVGQEKQVAVMAAMAAMVNLVLNLALVSRFGVVGAAAATAAALCLQSITAWWYARRLCLV